MKLIFVYLFILVSCSFESVNEEIIIEPPTLADQSLVEGGSLPILDITSLGISFASLSNVTYSCFYDRVVDENVERSLECKDLDGVDFDSTFGILTWNAPIEVGHSDEQFEILIVATDGIKESLDIFSVNVFDTNLAPEIDRHENVVITENSSFSNEALNVTDIHTRNFVDRDGDRIIYKCEFYNDQNILTDCSELGFTFDTSGAVLNGVIPLLPGHDIQTYTIVITGSDGELSSTSTFDIIVTDIEQPPKISPGVDQVVFEGQSVSEINFFDSSTNTDLDADGDLLSYTCFYDTSDNDNVSNTNPCNELHVSFNSRSGIFNWTPPYDLVSKEDNATTYEFKITATDNDSESSAFFTVKVFHKQEQSYVDVCAGEIHSCAIKSDGMIYCWGNNSQGQLGTGEYSNKSTPYPVNVRNLLDEDLFLSFKKVSCGSQHTCAMNQKNDVYCWGSNLNGRLGINSDEEKLNLPKKIDTKELTDNEYFKDITTGLSHTCGVTNFGNIYCWGDNSDGQLGRGNTDSGFSYPVKTSDPSFDNLFFKQVVTQNNHNCALDGEGHAYCWGKNSNNQTGTDTPGFQLTANKVEPSEIFVELSLGGIFSCGITNSKDVKCWGQQVSGTFGNTSVTDDNYTTPKIWDTSSLASKKAVSITSGYAYTCTIVDGGEVFCWGAGGSDQQGDGDSTDNLTPTQVVLGQSGNFKKISSNTSHTCGINLNGELYCWGDNSFNQLGDGTSNDSNVPVKVDDSLYPVEDEKFIKVLASNEFSCALSTVGLLYCWGDNENNQLATDSIDESFSPKLIVDTNNEPILFKEFSLGDEHACALKIDGTAVCWGANDKGQLGNNSTTNSPSPVDVVMTNPTRLFEKLYSNKDMNCGVESSNDVYCWGSNEFGKIGISSEDDTILLPTKVSNIFSKLSIGENSFCGLEADGEIACAGSNSHGQIARTKDSDDDGVDDQLEFSNPQDVSMSNFSIDNKFIDIAVGENHACALSAGGKVYCFGDNSQNQCGKPNGSEFDEVTLTHWYDEFQFTSIFAKNNKTCGFVGNGDAYCWGDGDFEPTLFYLGFRLDTTFKEISIGTNHSCGLTFSGDVYCWGDNSKGQLGSEVFSSSVYPEKVLF